MSELRRRFRAHYEREIGFLYNLLRRLGVAPADVEDVAHDVFTRVYQKLDRYDESRPFRPWLTAFAVPAAIDYRRKQRTRSAMPTEALPAPLDSSAQREAHTLVMRGLDALDDEARMVLVLHDLYGHSMREIAEIVGIEASSGYQRLRTARVRFADAVRRGKQDGER